MNTALFEQLLQQSESETLDFKREFPNLDSDMAKSELIKDILAFYNTPRTTDAYIIYGVEDMNGVPVLSPKGMATHAPYDDATIQQIVKDKANPSPEFTLEYFDYERKHFAAIKIPMPMTDKPARVVKDFGKLKQNELWRRVGSSSKTIVTADDLRIVDAYFAQRKTYVQLKNYTQKLAREYDGETIMQEETMTLQDVYIKPRFGVYKACLEIKDNYGHLFRDPENADLHTLISDWADRKPIINNIRIINDDLSKGNVQPLFYNVKVRNENVILLLGSPGQGKTSFCKRLLYDYYQQYEKQLLEKPVFRIKFRNLTDVERLVNNPLDILFDYVKGILPDIDRSLFNQSLLVLDGLDELMITERLSYNSIDQFCRNILRSAEGKDIKIVITSRYHVDIEHLKNDCLILSINSLTLAQQQDWLKRYLLFHPECKLSVELLEQFNSDAQFKHIQELIDQPILLHMVATTYTGETEELVNYANRAQVYDQLFTQLINRKWAKDGQIDALKGITKKDLRRLLQEIALTIFQSGREYLHKTELEALIKDKKLLQQTNNPNLQDNALKGVMMAAYMRETEKLSVEEKTTEDRSNYGIEFMHKSLQEYLTAEKMWTEVIEELTDTKRSGGYVVDNPDEALKIFHNLFGKRALTREIANALTEIIALQLQEDRTKLADRLEHFLPVLLQQDFLYEYNLQNKAYQYPMNMAMNTCYGYWHVLVHLTERRDYLENRERLLFLLLNFGRINENCKLSFSWQNLYKANLGGANLYRANLQGANLKEVNLSMSNLEGANLDDADFFEEVDFFSLISISHGTIYVDDDLHKANLYRANLRRANLRRTKLSGAILREADLEGADLSSADLEGADLSSANLDGTNLYGANLEWANLDNASLSKANLGKANLQMVRFHSAEIFDANLHGANLHKAFLSEVRLCYSDLQGANLQKANLQLAELHGSDFVEADLGEANLWGAILLQTNLDRSNLLGANLREADLTYASNLTYEQLTQVKTLYRCKGLNRKLRKRLLQTHPHLFKKSTRLTEAQTSVDLANPSLDKEEKPGSPPIPPSHPSSSPS